MRVRTSACLSYMLEVLACVHPMPHDQILCSDTGAAAVEHVEYFVNTALSIKSCMMEPLV